MRFHEFYPSKSGAVSESGETIKPLPVQQPSKPIKPLKPLTPEQQRIKNLQQTVDSAKDTLKRERETQRRRREQAQNSPGQ